MQTIALKSGDIKSLQHLREIAKTCVYVQVAAAFIYFLSSLAYPTSNTVAVTCGVLAIMASLTPVYYAMYTKHFQSLFSCVSAFSLAPIWFLYLEAVTPGYDAYEYIQPLYRMEACFWVAIFLVCTNAFYLLFWKAGTRYSVRYFSFLSRLQIRSSLYTRLTVLSFLVPMAGFYFFFGSGAKVWTYLTAGRSERGQELIEQLVGGAGAFMNPLIWLLQLAPLFGAIAFVSAKKQNSFWPVVSLVVGLLVIFIFFLSGSRGTMMFVAAPVLFFFFYYNWHKGLKFWIPASIMLFMLIGVMEMQVRFRGNLLDVIVNPEKAAKENDLKSATTFDPSKSHRDNNTYLLCLLIKGYPDKYEYEGFNNFFATVVNPIPRALWPGKPVMDGAQDLSYQPAFILDGPLFMGTTSLTFSVVGDAYRSKGIIGILCYGAVYALFLIFFDGIVFYTREKQALAAGMLGVGVFLSFWGFRSFFALMSFIYPIVLLLVTIRIVQMLRIIK
jgi:hypothetical protein